MSSESEREGSPEIVVHARRLAAGYDGVATLRGIDLEVRAGELWALLGGNGAGKTTFLRVLLGLLPPLSGEIWTHPEFAAAPRIGFVPQHCEWRATLPTTVREFVSLGLLGTAVAHREERSRITWALGRVGLDSLAGRSFAALSGGQRQRAVVARALVRRPSLLILDEPTAALDLPLEEAVLATLLELRAEGVTILLVVHDLSVARRMATHAALFRDGSVSSGPAEGMLGSKRIAALFGVDVDAVGGTP